MIRALEDGLRRDRTRATIQSFSNLGLLEFTRKRVGKDLGSQLRGSCPTCSGLGTVMSPQTVAIDTLRHVREGNHSAEHGHVVTYVAPTVAAQMEFWYEDEVLELSKEIAAKIHVRIDPMLHPERFRINRVTAFKDKSVLRVGDEHEVELLNGRLPNATSAAAVVDGHLIEVENAANNSGNSAKIRILDVDEDEDYVLAELVTAAVAGAAKKKRRRGGRGKALTASEEARSCASWPKKRPPRSRRGPRSASLRSPRKKRRATRLSLLKPKANNCPTRLLSVKTRQPPEPKATGRNAVAVAVVVVAVAEANALMQRRRSASRRRARPRRARSPTKTRKTKKTTM